MKIHLDIRHDISPTIALECVKQVIVQGKISANGKSYCYATTYEWDAEKKALKKIEQKPHTLWHPANGDYLPEIDREVIVLTQKNPLEGNEYAVLFAHRPPVSWIGRNIITDEKETFYPKRYEKAGWNIPYVKWWLDCELPTNKQEHGSKKL